MLEDPGAQMPADSEAGRRRPPLPIGFGALVGTVVVYSAAQAWIAPSHPDVSWLMYVADRVLAGQTLYLDLVEVNPPLIVWLSMPAALLMRIGVPPSAAGDLWAVALAGVSLLVLSAACRNSLEDPRFRSVTVFAGSFAVLQLVNEQLGQREHVMFAFVLPYMVLAAGRIAGRRAPPVTVCIVGSLAGLGFALKPHFLIPLAAVECLLVLRMGWRALRRPELLCVGAVFALYAAGIALVTPRYLRVALEFREIYAAYGAPDVLLQRSWITGAVLGLGVLARKMLNKAGLQCDSLVDVLVVASGGFLMSVYLQGKGFPYHWYPAVATGAVLMILMIWRSIRRHMDLLALLSILTFAGGVARSVSLPWSAPDLRQAIQPHSPGATLVTLSPVLSSAFPLVTDSGAEWGLRYPALWQIEYFYQGHQWARGGYRSLSEMQEDEFRFVQAVISDLERATPHVLIVDAAPPSRSMQGFDYREYFSVEPRFRRFFDQYRLVDEVSGRFRVYHRIRGAVVNGPTS